MSKYLLHKIRSVTLLKALRRILAPGLMLTALLSPCRATDSNVEVQYEPEQRKWYAILMGSRVEVEPVPESVRFEVFMSNDLNALPLSKVLSVKERVYREIEAFRYGKSEKLIESLQMDPEEYHTQWELKFERNKRKHFTSAIARGYVDIDGQQYFLDESNGLKWEKEYKHPYKLDANQHPDISYRSYSQTTGLQVGRMLKTLCWEATPKDQYKDWQEKMPPPLLQDYTTDTYGQIPEEHESFMGYCEHLILKESFDDNSLQTLPSGEYKAVDGDRLPSPYIYCSEDKKFFVTHFYEETWIEANQNERTAREFRIHRIMRMAEAISIPDDVSLPARLSKGVYQRIGARTYGNNQGDIWRRIDSDARERCTILYPKEAGYWIQEDADRCSDFQVLKQKMYLRPHVLNWKFYNEALLAGLLRQVELASHLNSLSVMDCKIDCMGAQALATLTNLTYLDLRDNKIGEPGAQALATLTNLTYLDLNYNRIGDSGAQALTALTGLINLYLRKNNIGETGAQALTSLTGLTNLDLYRNNIGETGAQALTTFTWLKYLDISSNNIGATGARALTALTRLTDLNLSNNNIGDTGVRALTVLTGLINLNLCRNNIGATGARALASLTGLTDLNLAYNIGATGVQALTALTGLTNLDLWYNNMGAGAQSLTSLTRLTNLNLVNNFMVIETENQLRTIMTWVKNLDL